MTNVIEKNAQSRMDKALEAVNGNMSKLRTGRAQPNLLDQISVDYYGCVTPLSQLANIMVEDSRTLVVQPYDQNALSVIEKAIQTSALGLNPATIGHSIRLPLPPLTEERRLEYIKLAKAEAENGRISVRNIRRDSIADIKKAQKDKEISVDEAKKAEERIQKLTNGATDKIDKILIDKEKDLLSV